SGRGRPRGLRRRSPARLVGDLSRGVYHRRAAGPRRGRPRPHHPAGAWAPARWPPPADGAPRTPRGAGHAQGGDPMSPRRSVGRDALSTSTRRKVRRARAPHGLRHATASHRWRRDRIAAGTARARAAPYQRRTAWDAAIAGYGIGSWVEYLPVPRVFGLGGPPRRHGGD